MTPETAAELARAVRARERRALARAVTLVESERPEDLDPADELLAELLPFAGRARRLGVSGVPGAGKSTLIDALGSRLLAAGQSLAVLAVDPTSRQSGGSLLGDTTRMRRLSADQRAFLRASPSGGASGGLGRRSREAALVLDAAGFDWLIVETVGVGQGELAVTDLVDWLLVVLLPGAGDEVQAMKRGILEHAGALVVNKADGASRLAALGERERLAGLFSWMRHDEVPVLATSALEGDGIDELAAVLGAAFAALEAGDELGRRRAAQQRSWFRAELEQALLERLRRDAADSDAEAAEAAVERRELPPRRAARRLLGLA